MQMNPTPQKRPDNIASMRGSVLGQMHQGEMQTHLSHPVLRFFIRSGFTLNITSLSILWIIFALMSIFPPHEAAFKWAIGSYFMFGIVYGVFASFFFKFAKHVEHQAVSQALTHNRRYEWHSQYDTKNMTEEDLKKMPEAQKQMTASQAINAGANYFRITGFLALAGLIIWVMGLWAFFGDFLASK